MLGEVAEGDPAEDTGQKGTRPQTASQQLGGAGAAEGRARRCVRMARKVQGSVGALTR